MSQVHHYYQENGPGTIKPCPRSIFLIINMSQVLLFIVPGPSLLPKEWPRDNQTMSLVHHYYLKNGPGTLKPCPRSIFLIINMSQGLSCLVPGPSLLLKEWPWDNQTMSQGLSCPVPGTSLRMALGQSKCVPGPYF